MKKIDWISMLITILLFMIPFVFFGMIFTIGASPENEEVLRAIGQGVGVIVYIIIDQCKLKN
jgi:hypothetical protein